MTEEEILEMSYNARSIIYADSIGYTITKGGGVYSPIGNFLATYFDTRGYYTFSIDNRKAPYKCTNIVLVHRFQGYKKFGEQIFYEDQFVRHLNGNKLDNSWDNIGIGTLSDNQMDIPAEVRLKRALHAASFNRKYDKEEVKAFHAKFKSYKTTMAEFGITSKGTLNYILNN